MIDFACRTFNIDEVIKCSLGLTRAEYDVFVHVTHNPGKQFVADDVAKSLDLDLTTVQRASKKLHGLGVLTRRQLNLEGGGYVFEYSASPKGEIRRIVMRVVNSWAERVDEELGCW